MLRLIRSISIFVSLLLLVAPANGQPEKILAEAETIYTNGTILTLNPSNDVAQAIALAGDRIIAVGNTQDLLSLKSDASRVIDLQGKTLIPGFYDAHSHLVATGVVGLYQVNLNSPPIGSTDSIDNLTQALTAKAQQLPAGEWIQGFGYDDTLLAERRHPTRVDLDRVSLEHPILITHTSGHLAVANSLALQLAGISSATEQPEGGVIRKDGSGIPSGILEEAPAIHLVSAVIPPLAPTKYFQAIGYAAGLYAEKGITTANDGAASPGLMSLLHAAAQQPGLLPIRVNAWPTLEAADSAYALELTNDRLVIGGVKEFADGSIQGYTGYLRAPYHTAFHGDSDYRGFPRHQREQLVDRITKLHKAGRQVMIHANGDAAIDDVLYAFKQAQAAYPRKDPRHVLIHAQMASDDQLDLMVELGVIPSFFELHTYYWGDRHRDLFMGPKRAARMSPTRSAAARGIRFTLHTDTPVVPMDPMLMIWSAVNRRSTSGEVIGFDQTITPLQALRATTIDAAYQNFEEGLKGSIEVGKLADLTILSDNPISVDPLRIKQIRVLETIVAGKRVFPSEHRASARSE